MSENRQKLGYRFPKIGQNEVLIPREFLKIEKNGPKMC